MKYSKHYVNRVNERILNKSTTKKLKKNQVKNIISLSKQKKYFAICVENDKVFKYSNLKDDNTCIKEILSNSDVLITSYKVNLKEELEQRNLIFKEEKLNFKYFSKKDNITYFYTKESENNMSLVYKYKDYILDRYYYKDINFERKKYNLQECTLDDLPKYKRKVFATKDNNIYYLNLESDNICIKETVIKEEYKLQEKVNISDEMNKYNIEFIDKFPPEYIIAKVKTPEFVYMYKKIKNGAVKKYKYYRKDCVLVYTCFCDFEKEKIEKQFEEYPEEKRNDFYFKYLVVHKYLKK